MYFKLGLILFAISSINCQSSILSTLTDSTTSYTSSSTTDTTTATKTSTTTITTTSPKETTTTQNPTITTTDSDSCYVANATCKDCLSEKCYFCNDDMTCRSLKFDGVFPVGCKASEARWLNCSINFEALLIAVGAIGFVILLIILCCICYCCNATCKSISDSNFRRVESKIRRQGEARRAKNDERRQERQSKNDAIRVKYGLKPSTYSELENE